ncbi:RagB/SusD family nutrient uptake outer membrane protein [Hymenobacter sp. BT770]|uniref:RagB/SusD family nutrient uptake outer membrane protein n=1 Tax=Hymenobacter sp. BT770 TaxID=2886942 RepID=UPI001D0FD765|nr:RagB/SusD family nutrient uptake outer membrane protein [Hymenobacter sp. BT770]MCC3152694.1 RagB/SusD family nutrient uptake outer membrane protein [Hymenobacter sp. BT770]MDO3414767.1 RagB/SusD family nutrient uptake outer membrane protein [Hymenobacter sp. BT770]
MKISLNKKAAVVVCTAFLAVGTFSCQTDKLSPAPLTLISDQVVFSTPARISLQVNNLYSYVKSGSFLGGRFQIYNDIRANDFINKTSNGVTGQSVWNHTLAEASQNDVINTWGAAYQAINQINVFLAGMDANASKFVGPVFPADFAAKATNYKAEARLLRALCYHSLLQLYARPYADGNGSKPGLPLRLQGETTDKNNDLARSSVADVYTQILADLNYAEQNLPLTNGSSSLNVTRAHRNTAIALKTRVYLHMARYTDVITEANKLVPAAAPFVAPSGVPHALNASVAAVFATPQETVESILSFPFTAQDAPGTQNQLAYYYLPSSLGGNGEYALNGAAGGILTNPGWAATDARRTSFVATSGTESFLKKYPTGTPFTDKAPVIRYAEVLLNLAEARVRSTSTVDPQALALLNAVRGRSNPAGVYTAASFATPTAMIDALLLERRIEFLGEGIRNMDIMRLNAPIPGKGSVPTIDPSNSAYVWPIPSTELATNKLMTRN